MQGFRCVILAAPLACLLAINAFAQEAREVSTQESSPDSIAEVKIEDLFENSLYMATGESGVSISQPKFVKIKGRLFVTSADGNSDEGYPNVSLVAWDSVHTIHVRGANSLALRTKDSDADEKTIDLKSINPEYYYRMELQKLQQKYHQVRRKVQLIDAFVAKTERELMDLNSQIEQQDDLQAVKRLETKIKNREEQIKAVAAQKEAATTDYEELDDELEKVRHEAVMNGVIPNR